MKPLRFSQSARRHRIGRASARHVIDTIEATQTISTTTGEMLWAWVGDDERGRELEIVAVEKPGALVVIHVMPTSLRRREP